MIYKLACVCCVVGYVWTVPLASENAPDHPNPTVIPIVAQVDELEPNGTYKFR